MTEKYLGKIEKVRFGIGGYGDASIGMHFTLSYGGYGTQTSRCFWDANTVERTPSCKWTEEERTVKYGEIVRYISDLLKKAKVDDISKLAGKPIEVEADGNMLKSWRILEEVL